MAKVIFVPLSRFYAQRDDVIGEDGVGRRRGGGGRRRGGGRARQRRGGGGRGGGRRRGGGGGGGGGARKGGDRKPERPAEPEEDRYAAMDEGAEEGGYEEDAYEDEPEDDDYDEEEDYEDEEVYDPYDDFVDLSVAGRRGWNPSMALGKHIQVRAAEGRRAAVKELEPGLWLVAEVPDEEAVGAIALASIILLAAKKALGKMGVSLANKENRGKLKEAVREAVLHAKARIKERRAKRKAKKAAEAGAKAPKPGVKKLRLPAPAEVGCRGRDRC